MYIYIYIYMYIYIFIYSYICMYEIYFLLGKRKYNSIADDQSYTNMSVIG